MIISTILERANSSEIADYLANDSKNTFVENRQPVGVTFRRNGNKMIIKNEDEVYFHCVGYYPHTDKFTSMKRVCVHNQTYIGKVVVRD